MKNLETLKLDAVHKERINEFAKQYARFAKLQMEVVGSDDKSITVKAFQTEPVNGKYLSQAEIIDRVKKMFDGEISEGIKVHVRPVVFNTTELSNISADYINSKLAQMKLQPKHLVQYLGIDKSTISVILSGEKALTKWQKAAFYYFFRNFSALS